MTNTGVLEDSEYWIIEYRSTPVQFISWKCVQYANPRSVCRQVAYEDQISYTNNEHQPSRRVIIKLRKEFHFRNILYNTIMKIFAKRSKKPATPAISEADKAVIEALKKTPEELNAKERRLIKRYQDRKKEEPLENDATIDATIDAVQDEDCGEGDGETKEENTEIPLKASISDEGMDHQEENALSGLEQSHAVEVHLNISKESDDKTDDIDEEEVKQLLDKLNSKNKRKLV